MKKNTPILHWLRLSLLLLILSGAAMAQGTANIFPSLSGQELIDSLRQNYKPQSVLSYDEARDVMFSEIDNHDDSVSCRYSGYTIYINPSADPSTDAYNKGINTEHTWPQSKGADSGNPKSDLHHLYPCREQVNSSRGNDPFDEIADGETDKWWRDDYYLTSIPLSIIDEYSEKDNDGNRFEPREDHKGNAARAVFYLYTMYSEQLDSNFFNQQKETLKDWNISDAVDSREETRNDAVAVYQDGKKNPFILDTTLVRRAYFEVSSAGGVANPSSFSAQSAGSTQIDLSWQKNNNNDDVIIVWNLSGDFDSPVDGTTYEDGQQALNGTIIGRTGAESYSHTGLDESTTYYYRIFSVNGSSGNEAYSSGLSSNATTSGSASVNPGDIVIIEIMQNPSAVYDSDGEWFEIYNNTDAAIDIDGWYIKDLDYDSHQINHGEPLIIAANDFLILGRNGNTSTNGGVEVDYEYAGVDLANGDDEILLLLADGSTEIVRVTYDGGPDWPDPNGASMYFDRKAGQDNNNSADWYVSDTPWPGSFGDLGTPGYEETASALAIKSGPVNSFALSNYPNPFNPRTVIRFNTPINGNVQIIIYNLLGERVNLLLSGYYPAGDYTVNWDGTNEGGGQLPAGIYFVVMVTAEKRMSKKITLMK